MENCKLIVIKILKLYVKTIEKIDTENCCWNWNTQTQKKHQQKGPISIKNIDINKVVLSNTISFGKKSFKLFFGYSEGKKWDLYAKL